MRAINAEPRVNLDGNYALLVSRGSFNLLRGGCVQT